MAPILFVLETSTPLWHLMKIWSQLNVKCALNVLLNLWRVKTSFIGNWVEVAILAAMDQHSFLILFFGAPFLFRCYCAGFCVCLFLKKKLFFLFIYFLLLLFFWLAGATLVNNFPAMFINLFYKSPSSFVIIRPRKTFNRTFNTIS